MSLDSVLARIGEIQSTIEGLAAPVKARESLDTGSTDKPNAGAHSPFKVALNEAITKGSVRPVLGSLPPYIEGLISKHASAMGVDPHLVRAVLTAESDGKPKSVSSKGAMGLMQLTKEECQEYGIQDPFDPDENIRGGVRQLAEKLKRYHGDIPLTLAAYNAGSGRVKQYNGIPPFPETLNYISRVTDLMTRYRGTVAAR